MSPKSKFNCLIWPCPPTHAKLVSGAQIYSLNKLFKLKSWQFQFKTRLKCLRGISVCVCKHVGVWVHAGNVNLLIILGPGDNNNGPGSALTNMCAGPAFNCVAHLHAHSLFSICVPNYNNQHLYAHTDTGWCLLTQIEFRSFDAQEYSVPIK